MAGDDVVTGNEASGPLRNPWPALITGLAAALVAVVLPASWVAARVILVAAGSLAAGAAVAIRPRSAAVVGAAAFAALLASVGVPENLQWDAAILLFRFLALVAGVAALLLLCPRPARRAVVSLIILFHFGGIMTAVTSTSPQPWLSGQLWTYVYRPYLQFLYLNNAYHFYSPEPGPASLLWFRIEYQSTDGNKYYRWVKVPYLDRDGYPVPWLPRVEFTRRLSLAESTNQNNLTIPDVLLDRLAYRRQAAGRIRGIPMDPYLPVAAQYREASGFSRFWIAAYARHVAHAYPHEEHPELPVTGVKVYRVVHRLPDPREVADEDWDMNDPTTFMPFFQGEFDADGKMKPYYDVAADGTATVEAQDPFLYWLIPIARFPKEAPAPDPSSPFRMLIPPTQRPETELRNYLHVHAGDKDSPKE